MSGTVGHQWTVESKSLTLDLQSGSSGSSPESCWKLLDTVGHSGTQWDTEVSLNESSCSFFFFCLHPPSTVGFAASKNCATAHPKHTSKPPQNIASVGCVGMQSILMTNAKEVSPHSRDIFFGCLVSVPQRWSIVESHTHSKRAYRGLHYKDRLERIKNPENKLLVAEPRVLEAPLAEGKGPSMRTQAATSANRVDLI